MYFAHFSIDFSTYFLLICRSSVYSLDISHRILLVVVDVYIENIFPSLACLLALLIMILNG